MQSQYAIQPTDRMAGITEITFDISVFDLFVTWKYGAALLVVPATQMMAPSSFIQRHRPTIVFTVPSIAASMQRMKLLAPNSMTSLRYSFFAGEPLPVASASMWKAAAPNSVVDNLFGPTEATVVCIGQRFHGPENATPARGVVAIGTPFPGMEAAIVDDALKFVPNEQNGELLLSGPQLSSGYFGDAALSEKCFPMLAGRRWYRTGDLAYRDTSGVFHHLGRIDNQVKVLGLRVELEEIEAHLREVYETDSVAVIAWPVEHGSASGIVAFVCGRMGADDTWPENSYQEAASELHGAVHRTSRRIDPAERQRQSKPQGTCRTRRARKTKCRLPVMQGRCARAPGVRDAAFVSREVNPGEHKLAPTSFRKRAIWMVCSPEQMKNASVYKVAQDI